MKNHNTSKTLKLVLFLGSFFLSLLNYSQDLQTYIDEAIANSPEIQKFELRYKITSEKVNEANWIPNTEFSVGYFISETETRVEMEPSKEVVAIIKHVVDDLIISGSNKDRIIKIVRSSMLEGDVVEAKIRSEAAF